MILSTDEARRDVAIPSLDGLQLHARHWQVASPRGVVVLAHGFGEHGGSYDHVARAIAGPAGVDMIAFDFRGHGLSPGRRGVVKTYDELTSDLLAVFEWAGSERPGLPRFILGHSNGGQVALRAALDPRGDERIAGLILSNPSLKLAFHVPGYKLSLGRFLQRHAPWVTLAAPLETEKLTRDPAMRDERNEDRLCHDRISAPLFFGMVEGGRKLLEGQRLRNVTSPIIMILGGADPIVDSHANRTVFEHLGSSDKTLQLYPEMLHEPFNELGREQVFADLIAWLDRHL